MHWIMWKFKEERRLIGERRLGLEAKLFPRSQSERSLDQTCLPQLSDRRRSKLRGTKLGNYKWFEVDGVESHEPYCSLFLGAMEWPALHCIRWVATRGKAKARSTVATPSRLDRRPATRATLSLSDGARVGRRPYDRAQPCVWGRRA